jgi:hypothetical protein
MLPVDSNAEAVRQADGAMRQPYEKPAVTVEIDLEVRAGTPMNLIDPLDLTGIGKSE